MKGTPQQSLEYCTKQDNNPFVYGDLPKPGKRNDLINVCDAIRAGATVTDLAQSEEHGPLLVKYYKGLTMYSSMVRGSRDSTDTPPNVFWFSGSTGKRKTSTAELFGKIVGGPKGVWLSPGGLRWFDGYDGQATVIFDDFRTKQCKFDFLLRLTDRFQFRVEFKGGFVDWRPKNIFITSPHSIRDTFETRNKYRPEDITQLQRRVDCEVNFDSPTSIKQFVNDWWPDGIKGYKHDLANNPHAKKAKPTRLIPITVPDSPVQETQANSTIRPKETKAKKVGHTTDDSSTDTGEPRVNGRDVIDVRPGGGLADLRRRLGQKCFSKKPAAIVRGNLQGFAIVISSDEDSSDVDQ